MENVKRERNGRRRERERLRGIGKMRKERAGGEREG